MKRVQCDGCKATIEDRGLMGVPVSDAPKELDGWTHLHVQTWKSFKPRPLRPHAYRMKTAVGDMEVEPTEVETFPEQMIPLQSDLDFCPECSARFREAIGDAAARIRTEVEEIPGVPMMVPLGPRPVG